MLFFSLSIVCFVLAKGEEESCEGNNPQETKHKRRSLSETTAAINRADDIIPSEYRKITVPDDIYNVNSQFWVSFVNDRNEKVELFWDDGTAEGRLQDKLDPLSTSRIDTYRGHKFYFRYANSLKTLASFVMDPDTTNYVLHIIEDQARLESEAIAKERAFKQQYRDQNGKEWIAYYPREPTKLFMYPITEIGQTFEVHSNYGYYHCYPDSTAEADTNKCKNYNALTFELVVASVSPKVLTIANVLSDFECDHIIELATSRLNRSTIGDGDNIEVSYTRTSSSTFISRKESEIIDHIHRRIADIMNINEGHLWNHIGCEDLQVLKYEVGQQFYDHPDYGTDSPNMRYLTFLMYLNDVEEGGETEFRSVNLKAFPKKGHVSTFYSALEDGNADVLSIHAGRPVIKGEKWVAPLWIWDPHR